VTATKLNGEVNVNLDEGGYLQYYDAQWIVAKLRYTIAGVVVNPKKGDRIIDSGGQEWELTPLEDLAEVTERDGGYEWLIRTKRVKAA
jgi:hypothetical protein